MTVVVDAGRRVADERHDTPQKQVALAVAAELLDGAAAHQSEVGVVIYGGGAQRVHEPVERKCRGSLEETVGGAAAAHAVDDVRTAAVGADHGGDGFGVVLKVGVDAHQRVGAGAGCRQSGKEGRLMSGVGRQVEAVHPWMGLVEPLDDGPGAVGAAVIDVEDETVVGDVAGGCQAVEQGDEAAGGLVEHGFFLVARNHDGKAGRRIHRHQFF